MAVRIIIDIIFFFSIVYAPFWLTLIALAVGVFYFKNYYEAIGGGLLIDMLYGVPLVKFFDIPFITTIVCTAVFIIVTRLKQNIR